MFSTYVQTRCITTDRQGSCIGALSVATNLSYTPYGVSHAQSALCIGFHGQLVERRTSVYLLGHGYRAYSPALMRFHSADSFSPFDEGGLNCYAFCSGDPLNNIDPTGHVMGAVQAASQMSAGIAGISRKAGGITPVADNSRARRLWNKVSDRVQKSSAGMVLYGGMLRVAGDQYESAVMKDAGFYLAVTGTASFSLVTFLNSAINHGLGKTVTDFSLSTLSIASLGTITEQQIKGSTAALAAGIRHSEIPPSTQLHGPSPV